MTFDPEGATAAAAEITVGLLFNPQRASRLVEYHARDAANPGLQDVIDAAISATWKAPRANGLQAETQAVTEMAVAEHLLALAANDEASPQARAIARERSDGVASMDRGNNCD